MNSQLNLLRQALDVSSLRQQTISNNIANANTANYKVEKVEFEEKFKQAMGAADFKLARTNEKHFPLAGDLAPEIKKRTTTSVKENGNNVDIELEMSEKAVNELYYSALTRQVNGELSMMNYVINH